MFSFFKANPIKKLNERYEKKLEEAMLAQRNGDIKGYSQLTFEAEQIFKEIQSIGKKL